MILKALYDYYQRLQAIDGTLPRPGFKRIEIPFVIVIGEDGTFQRIEDRRISKKESETFLVVNESRSSNIKPYPMFDNLTYVAAYAEVGKEKEATERNKAFKERCEDLAAKHPECKVFGAVHRFYLKGEDSRLREDPLWVEVVKHKGANLSFLLRGETEIAASKEELESEVSGLDAGECDSVCLITGKKTDAVKTTTATMIPGSQATAKLVAFQVSSGYDSYGKRQGDNAPISFEAETAYSAALLRLLGKNSRNKFTIGNRTYLFWSTRRSEAGQMAEDSLLSLWGHQDADDPNKGIEKARSAFMAIYSGKTPTDTEDKFYILGLAPNIARIAIVYWSETTVRDFAGAIVSHFNDMEIADGRKEPNMLYTGLRSILSAVTLGGKQSEAQPNLPDAVVKSIVRELSYPQTLYAAAIRRIRAEQGDPIRIGRVAILKAYINRTKTSNKLTVMLDKTNTNPGYVCGRLFAVVEYAQKRANNVSTVRERYMNSASATPSAVFSTLLNLSVHHVEKLDDGGRIFIEREKQEIISFLPAEGFPVHLDLTDQGRFFVGYYHQNQDLYTSKENKEK